MKIKKILLPILGALLLSLIISPISYNTSYAQSDNSISKVFKVKSNHIFNHTTEAPILRVEENYENEFGVEEQIFKLKLENAKWLTDTDFISSTFKEEMESMCEDVKVERVSDTTLEVKIHNKKHNRTTELRFKIPILVETIGDGEVKIQLDSKSSVISSGTYIIAVARNTITTIEDVNDFTDTTSLKNISIEETCLRALPHKADQKIELKLSSGFEWTYGGNIEVYSGLKGAIGFVNIDGDKLIITMDYSASKSRDSSGEIYLKGACIKALPKAAYGYVTMSVSGDNITNEQLEVAFYSEPINFADKQLEAAIRNAIDKPEGQIYSGDVKNIKKLAATQYHISDLKGIEHLINMKYLNLFENKIKDITPLSNLKKLEDLDLGYNEINDISQISSLINLKNLSLYENKIKDVTPLSNLNKLEDLDLKINEINNLFPISNLINLKKLNLIENKFTDITPLSKLNQLEDLELDCNEINDLLPISSLINLMDLSLSENKITDITPLSNLDQLENLDLDCNEINDIEPISSLINLKFLSLSENKIKDIAPLSKLKQLNDLYLDGNEINDLSPIKRIVSLKKLDISKNKITDITPLSELNRLDKLYINGNKINNIDPVKGFDLKFTDIYENTIKAKYPVDKSIMYINGEEIKTEAPNKLIDNNIYVPMEFVAKGLGVPPEDIIYTEEDNTITIFKNDNIVELKIGSSEILVRGVVVNMGVEPKTIDKKIYIPAKFVFEAFDFEVYEDNKMLKATNDGLFE